MEPQNCPEEDGTMLLRKGSTYSQTTQCDIPKGNIFRSLTCSYDPDRGTRHEPI
jgi:hypothetical protein